MDCVTAKQELIFFKISFIQTEYKVHNQIKS